MTPLPGIASTVALSDEAYHLLNEILESRLGLHFPEHQRRSLENRIQPRLRVLNLDDFLDYYLLLRTGGDAEIKALANAVTNNETYFFRERDQFEILFEEGVELLRPSLAVPGRLRILSAGCSSGEEAYTLSFYARDRGMAFRGMAVTIDGFDIDTARVDIAQRAACRSRSLRDMTDEQIDRYLSDKAPDRYVVKPAFREGVQFSYGNLVDLTSFYRPVPYDAVFCRNVLIYFSEGSLRRAVQNLIAVLRPGGLLFLGHSESIIGMFPTVETIRLGRCILYRKVRV